MNSDRRSNERCPICQGPATKDPKDPNQIRCRISICKYNHQHVKCPRCSSKELENVTNIIGGFQYTCYDCTYSWKTITPV